MPIIGETNYVAAALFLSIFGGLILFVLWGIVHVAKQKGSSTAEAVLSLAGSILGIVFVCAVTWLLPTPVGAIPSMFLGILGAVGGGWLGKTIGTSISQRK